MKKEYSGIEFISLHSYYFSHLTLNKGMQSSTDNADLRDDSMKWKSAGPSTKSDSKMTIGIQRCGEGQRKREKGMLREVITYRHWGDLKTVTKCSPHNILHSECAPNQLRIRISSFQVLWNVKVGFQEKVEYKQPILRN